MKQYKVRMIFEMLVFADDRDSAERYAREIGAGIEAGDMSFNSLVEEARDLNTQYTFTATECMDGFGFVEAQEVNA